MNLLNDIYNTIKESPNDDIAYENLRYVIQDHESIILSEEWLEDEDFALGTLAIAKYSSQFWKDYDSPIIPTNDGRKKRSSLIVGADVAGYVIGGVTGAAGGSFADPAGSVGGFLGGKAAGAWAGSAAAGTALLIYDAWTDFFSYGIPIENI